MPRLAVVARSREVLRVAADWADPVFGDGLPENGPDRASAKSIDRYRWAFGGGGPTAMARYAAGMSNGRVNRTSVPGLTASTTSPAGNTPRQLVAPVPAAFVPFGMNVVPGWTAVFGGSAMDLQVRSDHA